MDKHSVLKQYFGHTEFRAGQEKLIDGILNGKDVLGILPTGGGKSLCYQIPALMLDGLTIVISPLISLMKDQVEALRENGIQTAYLNSSLQLPEVQGVYQALLHGICKILYVAPERLDSEEFQKIMRCQHVSLIAVDEAHCISEWGQNFRPSYLKIAPFIRILQQRPIVSAFTATATERVQMDILTLLALDHPVRVVTGFDRPNLFFDVRKPKEKLNLLLNLIKERKEFSGIIYCSTRNSVEKVCTELQKQGIAATRYHAGLSVEERKQNQEDFQYDRKSVIVATNAFGMGIDKSNVGFVIHYNMPKSMEAYYQEAGRAGRDGQPADCILLFSQGDVSTARKLIDSNRKFKQIDPQEIDQSIYRDMQRLEIMSQYCRERTCFRHFILKYFGEPSAEHCGNCGNCKGDFVEKNITLEAKMILSCVKRVKDYLGYYTGEILLAQVLHGSRSKKITALGLERVSTYGLMKQYSVQTIRNYIVFLIDEKYLEIEPRHSVVRPCSRAKDVLFKNQQVIRMERKEHVPLNASRITSTFAENNGLFEALKNKRREIAEKNNVPAYVIFSNATLADMANKKPVNKKEFLEVSGVGEGKCAQYGDTFIQVIMDYEENLAQIASASWTPRGR